MSALTPLERLGLEVAAERLLCGNRGLGRMLSVLLQADGQPVHPDRLKDAIVKKREVDPANSRSAKVRISMLRSLLSDVGLKGVIVNRWGEGYAIPDPKPVIDRLRLEANP